MKSKLTIIAFSLILLASCVKHDDGDPGCEVKGTWMGRWSASTQEGTWVCYASNVETTFEGYVFVLFDLPALENRGVGVEGSLKDRQVYFKHYFSGATLTVKGAVDTDSSASGSFDVSNIGMSGTWQGERMPNLDISVVDSFPLNFIDAYQINLACDIVRNHLYIRNSSEVYEYNHNGGLIRTFDVEESGSICFDGEHLWMLGGSGQVVEIDTLGVKVSEFIASDNRADAIMFDGLNLKVSSSYSRKIYSISKIGATQGIHDYSYLLISGFCKYNQGYLAISHSFPGTIFKMNESGVPVKAFRFTSGYLRGIAIDGDDIWCISERYVMSSSNPPMPSTSIVKLYRLRLN